MSIIILTPPPKKLSVTSPATTEPTAAGTLSTDVTGLGERIESAFLHLIGQEGHHFADWVAVRDFAQAQIDAAKAVEVPGPSAE